MKAGARRKSCGWWSGLVAAGLSLASQAAPRTLAVGAGDCHDADLVTDLRLVSQALQERLGAQAVDELTWQGQVGPVPSSSPREIDLQLQNAKTLFFDGRYGNAQRQLDAALAAVRKLPPGSERWNLYAPLLIYRGNTLRHAGRLREASESFASVLRVNPDYVLDAAQFAPSTRGYFKLIRAQVLSAHHVTLAVESVPPGATVYLDGFAAGKTPYFKASLLPGSYEVRVGKDGAVSFAHVVELHRAEQVNVDLAVEGKVAPSQWPPCLKVAGNGPAVAGALTLGSRFNIEDVVLLRLDRAEPGPGWLTASVIHVPTAQAVREGRIKVQPGANPPPGMEDLVTFALTGETGHRVQPVVELSSGLKPVEPDSGSGASAGKPRHLWPEHAGIELGLAGAAVAAAGVGTFFAIESNQKFNRFNSYYANNPGLPTSGQVQSASALRSAAQNSRNVATYAFIGAGALLVADGVLFFWDRRSHSSRSSLAMSVAPSAASVLLTVRLP